MTQPPNSGTDLAALLAAAAGLPEHRRRTIEPRLVARAVAAEKFSAATAQLVSAWRELAEQSEALRVELAAAGIEKVPLARIELGSLIAAAATEMWRQGYEALPIGSPLRLPCICGGAVGRPDTLVPLVELVREANSLVRGRLA
jgi:hypothetical protein